MDTDRPIAVTLALLLVLICSAYFAWGAPAGASILSNSSTVAGGGNPGSRSDERGTITTLVLDAIQQDQNWKAYLGNVSGRLSLDSAAGFTIYDWELSGNVNGEVYVSRHNSISFDGVSCATEGNVTSDHPFYNMTDAQSDSLNRTFNATVHASFFVGTTQITADTCKSTATYVNDAQPNIATADFQEILLQDSSDQIIFATILSDNTQGYDNEFHDFQMIVPENDINSTATTYYFWTELDG